MRNLTQKQIQFISSLKQSKYRKKFDKFVIEGDKMCKETLQLHGSKIHFVCAKANWLKENNNLLIEHSQYEITDKEFKKISNLKTPNQVLIVLDRINEPAKKDSFNNKLCFYLDKIQDPGNLGTILRICDWFGIFPLYISPNSVDLYNSKTIQASMGTILTVPVIELSGPGIAKLRINNVPMYATTLDGVSSMSDIDNGRGGLMVIGNESNGISKEILEMCTFEITIKKSPFASIDSLNASVACGIIGSHISGQ